MVETTSFWSDIQGWNQSPQYYSTIQAADIDGDHCNELIAHGNGAIVAAKWNPVQQDWLLWPESIPCAQANGWDQPQCYRTIQCSDIDGNGQTEVLGRDTGGIVVWNWDNFSRRWIVRPPGPALSDANHWNQPEYYHTIQCADIDGDGQDELLARGSGGISVWKCNKISHEWSALTDGPALSDAAGWNRPQYYSTIQCADIDGDGQAELLARGFGGIFIWKCDRISHQWSAMSDGPALSDAAGWNQPQYYSTIQCADIDGDGQAELLARGSGGIFIWKCDKITLRWTALPDGPALSDAAGWNQPQYYSTIQCADLDGDGQAELLARGFGGISIWKYDPKDLSWIALANGPAWSNPAGWNLPQYYSTIQCADLDGDGRAELIARSSSGMLIWNLATFEKQPMPLQPSTVVSSSSSTQSSTTIQHSESNIAPDQLRSLLLGCLQTVGQKAQLVIRRTTFNDVRINQLLDTYYGGSDIVINNATISENEVDSSQIIVTGIASFLHVVDMPVKATFQASPDRVDLVLCYQLPRTWKFSQSFPTLPATWMPSSGLSKFPTSATSSSNVLSSTNSSCSMLDQLTFTDASFLVSTMLYTDQMYQVEVNPGLNFACHLRLDGLLGAIGHTFNMPEPLTLAGPIIMPSSLSPNPLVPLPWPPTRRPVLLPGINLKTDVHINLSIEQMTLKDVFLIFYSPLAESSSSICYEPGIFFGGTLQIGENLSVEVVAEKMLGNDNLLILRGTFDGLTLPDLSQFADLVGGDDLLNSLVPPGEIPSFFQQGSSLYIQSASLMITLSPFSLRSATLVVGLDSTWSPLDGLSITDLEALFRVDNPLNALRSLKTVISGTLSIGDVSLGMSARAPDFTVKALKMSGPPISMQSMLGTDFSTLSEISDLTINTFYLEMQPTRGFSLSATLADEPQPWTIDIGPETLSIRNMHLLLNYTKGSGYSGSLSGSLALAGVQLDVSYQYPGSLTLRGQFPSLSMRKLMTSLCGESIDWPSGFDIDLEQSFVIIEVQRGNLSLNVATEIEGLGLLALTVQKRSKWGFALGVDLSASGLTALPGLEMLIPFESFVGLDALMLVFSSLDQQPNFQFPDLTHFNAPVLGNRQVMLPPQANGLVPGLNLYARLNTTSSDGFQALAKYLGISLDGTVGLTLAVSLPNPTNNSKVFLSVKEEIQKGTTLAGELGLLLQGSDIGAYLSALVKMQVQDQPLTCDVIATVLKSGVLISGTMQGTIRFDAIQLSNLALVIGINWEGIPSLGIAATLNVSTFNSALALFFDSTDPARSLVAGALSDLSLRDIAQTLAGQAKLPRELDAVFGLIGLRALDAFRMPASVAPSLDNRDVSSIANAFRQYGNATIPGTSDRILLVINKSGANWHLTDLSTMKHYSLSLQGESIEVDLQPQLYLAPQPTFIGSLQYPSGFNVIASIDYLLIHTQINIQISPQQGILAKVDLEPIVLLNRNFFSLTGADGQAGPRLSLATFKQPHLSDPRLRDPHLLLSGNLRLLGVDMVGLYAFINERHLALEVSCQVHPFLHVRLRGFIESLSCLDAEATLLVGIANSLDLRQLGRVQVNVNVNGTLRIRYEGTSASIKLKGSFVFQNIQCILPPLMLNVDEAVLRDIEKTLWTQMSEIITTLLKDPDLWLSWVHSGVIHGAGQTAEEVGKILSSVYHLSTNDITAKTQRIMGYGSHEVNRALKGAGVTLGEAARAVEQEATSAANEAVHALEGAGNTVKDEGKKVVDEGKNVVKSGAKEAKKGVKKVKKAFRL